MYMQVFDPVCSLDTGTTYGNKCEAACAGDDGNLKKGECDAEPPQDCICPAVRYTVAQLRATALV